MQNVQEARVPRVSSPRVSGIPAYCETARPLLDTSPVDARTPMTRNVIVVPAELPLSIAWTIMTRERIRHLPVVRGRTLVGILSDRDVLLRATHTADGISVPHDPVLSAMTSDPITCEPDTSVSQIVRTMTERKIDALPVVSRGRVVGLVTSTDMMLLLLDLDRTTPLPYQYKVHVIESDDDEGDG